MKGWQWAVVISLAVALAGAIVLVALMLALGAQNAPATSSTNREPASTEIACTRASKYEFAADAVVLIWQMDADISSAADYPGLVLDQAGLEQLHSRARARSQQLARLSYPSCLSTERNALLAAFKKWEDATMAILEGNDARSQLVDLSYDYEVAASRIETLLEDEAPPADMRDTIIPTARPTATLTPTATPAPISFSNTDVGQMWQSEWIELALLDAELVRVEDSKTAFRFSTKLRLTNRRYRNLDIDHKKFFLMKVDDGYSDGSIKPHWNSELADSELSPGESVTFDLKFSLSGIPDLLILTYGSTCSVNWDGRVLLDECDSSMPFYFYR